jgi:hypothetical protein
MIASQRHRYPELRQLFGAYLNADFADDYGTVAAALAAYLAETGAGHRRAAMIELVRLRATTSSHADFAAALGDLGCAVAFERPADAHALAERLVEALRELDERGGE